MCSVLEKAWTPCCAKDLLLLGSEVVRSNLYYLRTYIYIFRYHTNTDSHTAKKNIFQNIPM